jgi:hypothetical protein
MNSCIEIIALQNAVTKYKFKSERTIVEKFYLQGKMYFKKPGPYLISENLSPFVLFLMLMSEAFTHPFHFFANYSYIRHSLIYM